MEWLANNATNGYFLLGFAAFMLAGLWWVQKQAVYLLGAGAALVALGAFWFVIHNVPTTAMRLEAETAAAEKAIRFDLEALAQAVLKKDHDAAQKYVISEFTYGTRKTPEKWLKYFDKLLGENEVDALEITDFKLKKREGDEAHVAFHLDARAGKKTLHTVVFLDCKMVRAEPGAERAAWQLAKVRKAKDDD